MCMCVYQLEQLFRYYSYEGLDGGGGGVGIHYSLKF